MVQIIKPTEGVQVAKQEFSFEDPENMAAADGVDSVDAIAAELVEQMPEPQPHAIAQHEAAQVIAAENVPVDSEGTPFDPELHTGSTLKSGKWRMRKGKSSVAKPASAMSVEVDNTAELQLQQSMAAGQAAAGCFFMLGQGLFGEEWEPTKDETKMHEGAWGAYFYSKQITDFPPGAALCVALVSFAATRVNKPKTKARLLDLKSWATRKYAAWKVKRELKKRGITADVTVTEDNRATITQR